MDKEDELILALENEQEYFANKQQEEELARQQGLIEKARNDKKQFLLDDALQRSKGDVYGAAARIDKINKLFDPNLDFSNLEGVASPETIEKAKEIRMNQLDKEIDSMISAISKENSVNQISSSIIAGKAADSFHQLSDDQKIENILAQDLLAKRIESSDNAHENPFDSRTPFEKQLWGNNWRDSAKAAGLNVSANGMALINNIVRTGIDVADALAYTAAKVGNRAPKNQELGAIKIARTQAYKKGDMAEFDRLSALLKQDQEGQLSFFEETPLGQKLNNLYEYSSDKVGDIGRKGLNKVGLPVVNTVGGLFGMEPIQEVMDNNKRDAMALSNSGKEYKRMKEAQYVAMANQGDPRFLDVNGNVDRKLISKLVEREWDNNSTIMDSFGNKVAREAGQILDPTLQNIYRQEHAKVYADKNEKYVAQESSLRVDEDSNAFKQVFVGTLENTTEGTNKMLERSQELRKTSDAARNMKEHMAAVDNFTDRLEKVTGIQGLGSVGGFLTKSLIVPLAHPIDSSINQGMQIGDAIGMHNPLLAASRVSAEMDQNVKRLEDAIRAHPELANMTQAEKNARLAEMGFGSLMGVMGDVALNKIISSTLSTGTGIASPATRLTKGTANLLKKAESVPIVGKPTSGLGKAIGGTVSTAENLLPKARNPKDFKENLKAMGGYSAAKIGSPIANLAEGELQAQATSLSGAQGLSQAERNEIIADSVMPSLAPVSIISQTVSAAADKTITTVGKGTNRAADIWSKTVDTYQQKSQQAKELIVDLPQYRQAMDIAENISKKGNEAFEQFTTAVDPDTGETMNVSKVAVARQNLRHGINNLRIQAAHALGTATDKLSIYAEPKIDDLKQKAKDLSQKPVVDSVTQTLTESYDKLKDTDVQTAKKAFGDISGSLKESFDNGMTWVTAQGTDLFNKAKGVKDSVGTPTTKESIKENQEFATSANELANRGEKSYKNLLKKTKDYYKELVKKDPKEVNPKDISDMADDILHSYEDLAYTPEELKQIAESPAVKANKDASERIEFARRLYGMGDPALDQRSGFIAPMARDYAPKSPSEAVAKEFFYGGGKRDWSRGIFNYIQDLQKASDEGNTDAVAYLKYLATKWRDHQASRINEGKIKNGTILERAKSELGLINRLLKYADKQEERANNRKETVDEAVTPPLVQEAPIQEENNVPVEESKPIEQQQEEVVTEPVVDPILQTINEIVAEDKIEQEEATVETSQNNEVITEATNAQISEGMENSVQNAPEIQKSNKTENQTKAFESAKEVRDSLKPYRMTNKKSQTREEITGDRLNDSISDLLVKFRAVPDRMVDILRSLTLRRSNLPKSLLDAQTNMDSNSKEFKNLENYVERMNRLTALVLPEFNNDAKALSKHVEVLKALYDIYPTLNSKDATAVKGYINTIYKSAFRVANGFATTEGIDNIGIFTEDKARKFIQDNNQAVKKLSEVKGTPITFQNNLLKKNKFKRTITDFAVADSDKPLFRVGKGLFRFAIGPTGEISNNKEHWFHNEQAFVTYGMEAIKKNSRYFDQNPLAEQEARNNLKQIFKYVHENLGNDALNPDSSKTNQWNKDGHTNSFGKSPLATILYSVENNKDYVLDDSVKATMLVNGIQFLAEDSSDLTLRDKRSVAAMLGYDDQDLVNGKTYQFYKDKGMFETTVLSKLQTYFMGTFQTNFDPKKTPHSMRERMAGELAAITLAFLKDTGHLVKSEISQEAAEKAGAEYPYVGNITAYKLPSVITDKGVALTDRNVAETLNAFKTTPDIGYSLTGAPDFSNRSRPVRASKESVPIQFATDTYTQSLLEGAQKHANNTTYKVIPYFGKALQNEEHMMKLLGYDVPISQTIAQRELQESAQASRDGEIATLQKNMEFLRENPFMLEEGFKQGMSIYSNGRTAITSNVWNIMSDKVSRALVMLEDFEHERFKKAFEDNPQVHDMYLYSLAIRFGAKEVDNNNTFNEVVDQMKSLTIPNQVKEAVTKMRNNEAEAKDLRILANFGRDLIKEKDNELNVINAIYEITNYQELMAGNIDSYKSYLSVDNDAKNSGVAIIRSLMGETNFTKDGKSNLTNINQVGIYNNDSTGSLADYFLRDEATDAYLFAADSGYRFTQQTHKGMTYKDLNALGYPYGNPLEFGQKVKLRLTALTELLGGKAKSRKFIRNIAKPLLMTAYYEAGVQSMLRKTQAEVSNAVLERMNDIIVNKDEAGLKSFNEAFKTNMSFDELASTRAESKQLNNVMNYVEGELSDTIGRMIVVGTNLLTQSTKDSRTAITKATIDWTTAMEDLHLTSMANMSAQFRGEESEVKQYHDDKLLGFISDANMKLMSPTGDRMQDQFGHTVTESDKGPMPVMVPFELTPALAKKYGTFARYKDMASPEEKEANKAKIEKHNETRMKNARNQMYVEKEHNKEKVNFLPNKKKFSPVGVGTMANLAHLFDGGIVDYVYKNTDANVYGVYDQFTTSPENAVQVAKLANEGFKKQMDEYSAVNDVTEALATSMSRMINEYNSDPEIQNIVDRKSFLTALAIGMRNLNSLYREASNVSIRRNELFGNNVPVVVDNYPLGKINSEKNYSATDSTPISMKDSGTMYQEVRETIQSVMAEFGKELSSENLDKRMDGYEAFLNNIDKHQAKIKAQKETAKIVKSAENKDIRKLQEWAKSQELLIATPETLANTLGIMNKMDGDKISESTKDSYVEVLSDVINPILESSKELDPTRQALNVKINESLAEKESFGFFDPTDNSVVMATAHNSGFQTNSEVFMHELVHAATFSAIEGNKEVQSDLFDTFALAKNEAMKEGWNDPSSPNHKQWNYVFNNPNNTVKGNSVALHEFVSYGLTNPSMIGLLKNIATQSNMKDPISQRNMFTRLVDTVSNIVKALFNNKTTDSNAHQNLMNTIKNIDAINRVVIENNNFIEQRSIKNVRDTIASLNAMGDSLAEKTFTAMKNSVKNILDRNKENPVTTDVVTLQTIMSLNNVTPEAKAKLIKRVEDGEPMMDVINDAMTIQKESYLSSESTMSMAKNTITGKFNQVFNVKKLVLRSLMKTGQDAELARSTIKERLKTFRNSISDEESTAITSGLMSTGAYKLKALISDKAMADFILSDDRAGQISHFRGLIDKSLPDSVRSQILSQLDGLANALSGEGKLVTMQMQNVHNIVNGFFLDSLGRSEYRANAETLNQLKPLMEAYVTMKAFDQSTDAVKDHVVNVFRRNVNNDGTMNPLLADAIDTIQETRNTSMDKEFGGNEAMMNLGYTSKIGDPNLMEHFVPEQEVGFYQNKGWEFVGIVQSMDGANGKIAMLQKRIPPDFGYNAHALNSANQRDAFNKTVTMFNRLYGLQTPFINKQDLQEMISKEMEAASRGATQNRFGMTPIINAKGETTGFTHPSTKHRLPIELQKDRDFALVVADEFAQVAGNYSSKQTSKELISALHEDFRENFAQAPNDFVRVGSTEFFSDGTRNPYFNAYKNLTPEVKIQINNEFGSDGLYVRKGMVRAVIGSQKFNLADSPVGEFLQAKIGHWTKDPKQVRDYIQASEAVWREIVSLSKSAIAVMNPAVFAMNYMSNNVMLMINGISPTQILKYTKESMVELKKYESMIKDLNNVQMKLSNENNESKRRALLAQESQLNARINASLTKELVDNGMMQSIQTEMEYNEYGYLSRAGQAAVEHLNNIDQNQKLGNKTSAVFKEVFMLPKSTTGTVMSYGNQIMDFTSRYVYMKAMAENQAKIRPELRLPRERILREAQDLFINYALPDGKGLEWANAVGAVWFSKYYMGIQHVIMQMFKTKPVNSLAYTAGAAMGIYSADDIFKNSILVDSPMKLFRTPMDAISTLSTPPLIKAFF